MALSYPVINPVAFSIGPVAVHWYGLMYLIGFVAAWLLLSFRVKHRRSNPLWLPCVGQAPAFGKGLFSSENISDIIFYGALGVILGGRIGYILFYDFSTFLHSPLLIVKIWQGGMSFHGGLLGVIIAMFFYARTSHYSLFDILDFISPVVPIGLGAGRIGNFINGELWGKVTHVSWAMVFPQGGPMPRHPSELYEFLLEGVLLFIIMWFFSSKPRPKYAVSGLFLICYGIFRCFIEFFREPDVQLGYLLSDWVTMGQILCIPMILIGIFMVVYAYYRARDCHKIAS